MKIEWVEKCKSCHGTGIYVGMAERHGVGVVCHTCKGSGKVHQVVEYEEFTHKEVTTDIQRVIETNPGIICGPINGSIDWVGGMAYEEWLSGKQFAPGMEMREHTCPCWWYQCTDYKKKPEWVECLACGSFSSCIHFGDKASCWERWDREHKQGSQQ
jgi:hypothetical protein